MKKYFRPIQWWILCIPIAAILVIIYMILYILTLGSFDFGQACEDIGDWFNERL